MTGIWVFRLTQISVPENNALRLEIGLIGCRSIKSRSVEVILKLYLALVRPHLDYAMQFWSLYYRMDIILLESVQRSMTKMIEGIYNFSYERRLKLLKLHSLERRRVKGKGIRIEQEITDSNERNVDLIGRNWFTNRVVDD